jgi:hypothetical protein
MRRFKFALLMLVLAMALVACNTTFEKNAYTTLESVQAAWETSMGVAADLHVAGHISEEDWQNIASIGDKVAAGGYLATAAMETYAKVLEDQEAGSAAEVEAKEAAITAVKAVFAQASTLLSKVEALTGKDLGVNLTLLI